MDKYSMHTYPARKSFRKISPTGRRSRESASGTPFPESQRQCSIELLPGHGTGSEVLADVSYGFVCHFIPTSSSWLNLVERWFGELTQKAIRCGSFVSVPDLQKSIEDFLAAWNLEPRPFIWTAKVEDIMKKIDRARAKLEEIKPGCTQPRGKKKKNAT